MGTAAEVEAAASMAAVAVADSGAADLPVVIVAVATEAAIVVDTAAMDIGGIRVSRIRLGWLGAWIWLAGILRLWLRLSVLGRGLLRSLLLRLRLCGADVHDVCGSGSRDLCCSGSRDLCCSGSRIGFVLSASGLLFDRV